MQSLCQVSLYEPLSLRDKRFRDMERSFETVRSREGERQGFLNRFSDRFASVAGDPGMFPFSFVSFVNIWPLS